MVLLQLLDTAMPEAYPESVLESASVSVPQRHRHTDRRLRACTDVAPERVEAEKLRERWSASWRLSRANDELSGPKSGELRA